MQLAKEYTPAPRGKFRGQKTVVYRCDSDDHRVTSYVVKGQVQEIEVRAGSAGAARRSRASQLLERAEALS